MTPDEIRHHVEAHGLDRIQAAASDHRTLTRLTRSYQRPIKVLGGLTTFFPDTWDDMVALVQPETEECYAIVRAVSDEVLRAALVESGREDDWGIEEAQTELARWALICHIQALPLNVGDL